MGVVLTGDFNKELTGGPIIGQDIDTHRRSGGGEGGYLPNLSCVKKR